MTPVTATAGSTDDGGILFMILMIFAVIGVIAFFTWRAVERASVQTRDQRRAYLAAMNDTRVMRSASTTSTQDA